MTPWRLVLFFEVVEQLPVTVCVHALPETFVREGSELSVMRHLAHRLGLEYEVIPIRKIIEQGRTTYEVATLDQARRCLGFFVE